VHRGANHRDAEQDAEFILEFSRRKLLAAAGITGGALASASLLEIFEQIAGINARHAVGFSFFGFDELNRCWLSAYE
jgi:hypothetical protein